MRKSVSGILVSSIWNIKNTVKDLSLILFSYQIMSSAGTIFDMINRFRYNESMRKLRRERYAKVKEAYLEEYTTHRINFADRKKLSPEELRKLKEGIRQKLRRIRRRNTIITFIIALFIITILTGFFLVHFMLVSADTVSPFL